MKIFVGAARRTRVAVVCVLLALAACGDPELSDEAQETEGSGDPLGETGSPAPGIPPAIPGLSLPL